MATKKKKEVLISQSFIKDVLVVNSPDPKEMLKPAHCPMYLKHKYVDGLQTIPSDAMLYGQYFEWHLLGATRDGIEPLIPKVGVRDLRPPRSASKNAMIDYIMEFDPKAIIKGTGKQTDLKPKGTATKEEIVAYIEEKGGVLPEKQTKNNLMDVVAALPADLGEPEITVEDYFAHIEKMPENLSSGSPSAQELRLDLIVEQSKAILGYMGLDVAEGVKQMMIRTDDGISGALDWVTIALNQKDKKKKAIYDVKFTKTKVDDWRNGWGEPESKEDARIQASHYIHAYHLKYGEYIPFYFIVFGEDGWIKVLRYKLTPEGLQNHIVLIGFAREELKEFERTNWKARPSFNRCLQCDFSDVCKSRALLPEIETIVI